MSAPLDATAFPRPEPTEHGRAFWDALQDGRLTFQRCAGCGHAWLPARAHCPKCLSPEWRREDAGGRARLISWVVYRIAYHPAFESRLPYVVAVVELDEGPRMISNVVRADPASLRIEQPLALVVEREDDVAVPRFTPA